MRKTVLLTLAIGFFIGACSGPNTSVPVATAIPSPTAELSEAVPTLVAEIKLETQTGTSYTLDWSPDGKSLAVASGAEITLLSQDLNETQAILEPEGGALGVTWSADAKQFATVNGYRNETIALWDLDSENAQLTRTYEVEAGSDQYGVSWSPDGKLLATLADDQQCIIQIWDTNTREELSKFDLLYTNPRRAFNWSADSSRLYGAGESKGQLVVFAVYLSDESVQEIAKFPLAEAEVFALSPEAEKLAVSDARGVVQILHIASSKVLTGFKSVDQPVDIAWNPNGLTLAILDYKTTLQLWKVSD